MVKHTGKTANKNMVQFSDEFNKWTEKNKIHWNSAYEKLYAYALFNHEESEVLTFFDNLEIEPSLNICFLLTQSFVCCEKDLFLKHFTSWHKQHEDADDIRAAGCKHICNTAIIEGNLDVVKELLGN